MQRQIRVFSYSGDNLIFWIWKLEGIDAQILDKRPFIFQRPRDIKNVQ